jgi:hypothetical protein
LLFNLLKYLRATFALKAGNLGTADMIDQFEGLDDYKPLFCHLGVQKVVGIQKDGTNAIHKFPIFEVLVDKIDIFRVPVVFQNFYVGFKYLSISFVEFNLLLYYFGHE